MSATHGNGVQSPEPPLRMDATHVTPALSNCGANTGRTKLPEFLPPPACKRILIVGAGGFGREVLQWARDAWPDWTDRLAGFLSADPHALDGFDQSLAILDSPEHYRPAPGDFLLLAIGVPYVRRQVAESLLCRGGEFLTLVHPTAILASSARIGTGAIVCPYAIASDTSHIEDFVLINYHASLGHDAVAGGFSVLSPYATLGGRACIGEDVFLGLHASIGPGRVVGNRSKVSANSCVLTHVPADSMVFGVPGRVTACVTVAR